MARELTEKQKRFLTYLETEIHRTGRTPSLRQAAKDLGVSHAAVVQYRKSLEEKGYLQPQDRYSRRMELAAPSRPAAPAPPEPSPPAIRWREVPIVGRIAAGLPLYAQEEWDGTLVVDAAQYRQPTLFGLRVRGDSMIRAGILDGDVVLCEPRQFARDGEIVVALLSGEEATVKRFFLLDGEVELRPENDAYSPRRYDFGDVLIQGRVVGLWRGPLEAERL